MNQLVTILLLAFCGSVVALVGGVVFLVKRSWSAWLAEYSVPFAAGVLLVASLMGMLPEAEHLLGHGAYGVVVAAFIGSYMFEQLVFGLHHHDEHRHGRHFQTAVPLVIIGDTIHNLIDGVAIAATYIASPGLGVITTISTFLHEVPHEIGDFGILYKAGWKRGAIFWVNLLSASATFVGAMLAIAVGHNEQVIGIMMAAAAGMFLYLAASDFLPHIGEGKGSEKKSMIALMLGIVIMWLTLGLVPHEH